MLLEAPRKEENENNGGSVTYLKLYLMTINVVKSIMLVVAVLGPQNISTAILSSIFASCILGILTFVWFYAHDISNSHYSADIHPCNIAFINFWKAASYTAAVASAIVLVIAHSLDEESFPGDTLTQVLVVCWVLIVATFVLLYVRYSKRIKPRRALVEQLVSYPFKCRDSKDTSVSSPDGWFGEPHSFFDIKELKLPGFKKSPWYDEYREQCGSYLKTLGDLRCGDLGMTEILLRAKLWEKKKNK